MLTLDRSSVALDGRKLTLHVGPRDIVLALSDTDDQAGELARILEAGQHDRLVVRERQLKVNVRHELVLVVAGIDVPLASFCSPTDAAMWSLVTGEQESVPALPEIRFGEGKPAEIIHADGSPAEPRTMTLPSDALVDDDGRTMSTLLPLDPRRSA